MQRKMPWSLTAFSWRCAFIELEIALDTFLIHTYARIHVQMKGMPYRRFWISNRNGTDAINEPSLVINRFPLETVIHRRLALSQLISCRYRRSNKLTCICGSEYVIQGCLMEINILNSLPPVLSLRMFKDVST